MKSLTVQAMNKSSIGTVFDIKKFAVHDGVGIRTTVFLKGCNLKCVWCHNPEGLSSTRNVTIKNSCIHCNRCKSVDDDNVVYVENGKRYIMNNTEIDYQKYIDICPIEAISYDSKYYQVEELVQEILDDCVFLKYGGVTFSGGEPLLHYDFLLACVKRLKQENIHIAIESAMVIDPIKVKSLIPYIDEWFCDLKIFNDNDHKKYTGVSNKLVLKNIEQLLENDVNITIRTPLIPTLSATKKNIKEIATYLYTINKDVKLELLNYNPLALSKYQSLKMKYYFDENPSMFSEEQMKEFRNIAANCGINNIK